MSVEARELLQAEHWIMQCDSLGIPHQPCPRGHDLLYYTWDLCKKDVAWFVPDADFFVIRRTYDCDCRCPYCTLGRTYKGRADVYSNEKMAAIEIASTFVCEIERGRMVERMEAAKLAGNSGLAKGKVLQTVPENHAGAYESRWVSYHGASTVVQANAVLLRPKRTPIKPNLARVTDLAPPNP